MGVEFSSEAFQALTRVFFAKKSKKTLKNACFRPYRAVDLDFYYRIYIFSSGSTFDIVVTCFGVEIKFQAFQAFLRVFPQKSSKNGIKTQINENLILLFCHKS